MRTQLRTNGRQAGFTLIEVSLVCVIVGVLAAIALPTLIGQRDKATDSQAKADVRNALTEVESCFVQASDYGACTDAPAQAGISGPTVSADAPDGPVTITEVARTGNAYSIRSDGDEVTRTCTVAGSSAGGCPADGTW